MRFDVVRGVLRWLTLAVLVAVIPLSACARSDTPGDGGLPTGPPSVPPMTGVTITRTGGFAGVNQGLEVSADGSWVYTDKRSGASERGQFTADQLGQLHRLALDPAFVTQARSQVTKNTCADTFKYTIAAGDFTAQYDDCDAAEKPAVKAVVELAQSLTPL